ncbi:MAG: T9SS type B sorting domain-containing protein, partial [Croceivirga sp.]
RTYFGLRGYLASITSPEEAQLSGEQAAGDGWIGGSDETNEGIWRWMTGPEAGTIFWNGGISGSSPNFEFWNTNEPNNCCEGEDYAHVTSPNVGIPGSWNDLSNEGDQLGDFQPKGYIVEYGGFTDDPELQLSASTKLRVPKIKATTEMANCGPGNLQLSAEATEGEVLWFDAPDGGNLIYSGSNFLTPVLNETTSYFVLASVNGCIEGKRTEVVGTIHPLPLIETTLLFKNCDEDGNPDGIVDFNLNEATDIVTLGDTDMEVTYHLLFSEAEASVNEINTSPFSNAVANMVYARVETSFGCYAIATVNLEVSITSFPTDFVAEIELCDGDEPDGFYEFDLRAIEAELLDLFPLGQNLKASFYRTAENALLEEQEINEVYRNEVAFSQILFVRVENQTDGACFGIGPHVRLAVLPLVDFSLPNQIQVCTGTTETVEIFDAEGEYIYEWKDANNAVVSTENTASLSEPGIYEVLAISENGCISPTKTIEVKASEAPNLRLDLITSEQVDGINSIVIEKEELGLGDYEFSLDNPFGPFQDSPIFNNVLPGMHMVYAADKNGCGGDALEIGVIGISNFITPNADNNNDFLEVLGITEETYQSVSLKIFNRYGKLLSQLNGFSDSWDGRVQNQLLPSSDYWFILEAIDFNGNLQKRTGHFTLKR